MLLLALLAVAAVVWLLIARPWSGAAAESAASPPSPARTEAPASELPVPAASAPAADSAGEGAGEQPADPGADAGAAPSAEPSPSASGTPTAKPCVAKDVTVEPVTDQSTYGSGQNPQLSIRLTNKGETDCTLNVGTSTQAFTVKSGDDLWWRSTDCQTAPSDMVVMLAAGQTVSSAAPLAWDRTRSEVATCADTDRQAAPGGGASYHVSVEIGGIASTQSAQLLLY